MGKEGKENNFCFGFVELEVTVRYSGSHLVGNFLINEYKKYEKCDILRFSVFCFYPLVNGIEMSTSLQINSRHWIFFIPRPITRKAKRYSSSQYIKRKIHEFFHLL